MYGGKAVHLQPNWRDGLWLGEIYAQLRRGVDNPNAHGRASRSAAPLLASLFHELANKIADKLTDHRIANSGTDN